MEFTSFSFCEEIESFRKRFEGKEATIPSRCHGRGYRAQGAVMGSGIRARKKKKKKKKKWFKHHYNAELPKIGKETGKYSANDNNVHNLSSVLLL